MNLITLVSFRGNHGSMIYLNNYLSIMFNISDVLIDQGGDRHENETADLHSKRNTCRGTRRTRVCVRTRNGDG